MNLAFQYFVKQKYRPHKIGGIVVQHTHHSYVWLCGVDESRSIWKTFVLLPSKIKTDIQNVLNNNSDFSPVIFTNVSR